MCQWNNARETSEVASLFRSSKIFIFYFNKKVFTDSSFSVDIYQVFGGMDGTFCRFSICNKLTIGRMFMRRPSGQILVLASFVIMHHQQPSYKLTAMTNNKIKCLQHLTKHFLSSVTFCPPNVSSEMKMIYQQKFCQKRYQNHLTSIILVELCLNN